MPVRKRHLGQPMTLGCRIAGVARFIERVMESAGLQDSATASNRRNLQHLTHLRPGHRHDRREVVEWRDVEHLRVDDLASGQIVADAA